MKLGTLEYLTFTNPLWGTAQRTIARHLLPHLAPLPSQAKVLDLGCGAGHLSQCLLTHFHPQHLTAVDLDPRMVTLTHQRLQTFANTHIQTADAANLPFANHAFSVISCAGAIHHVPNWQQAVKEISRVLQPQGLYYGLEIYSPFLHHPLVRRLAPHPPHRFTHQQFISTCQQHGLTLLKSHPFLELGAVFVFQKS